MIEISERAADALRAAMARTDGQAAGVRITASKEGCSPTNYSMGLVSQGLDDDLEITTPSGLNVFVGGESVSALIGCVLDYGETETGLAFSFFNPNDLATADAAPSHGCSCGKGSCS